MSAFEPERFFEPARIHDAEQGRRHRRVSMELPMKYRLAGGELQPGVLADLSVRGAWIAARPGAMVGDEVSLFVQDLTRLDGKVARLGDRGFGVSLGGGKADRAARADALMVFLNRPSQHSRAVRYPTAEESVLETVTGQVAHCVILDVSETGASVATALYPALGEKVRVGRKRGVVVRHHEDGIGISFTGSDGQRVR